VAKSIKCDDLFPGCDFEAQANSEEELLENAAAHAVTVHNVTDEIVAKVKSCIRDI